MIFSTIRSLSRSDMLHVPEHIRIDRMTTDSAVRKHFIRGRRKAYKQFAIMNDEAVVFVGTADEVSAELGLEKSLISSYCKRGTKFVGQLSIVRVEE